MGFCVDEKDTPHGVEFELRRESVAFWDADADAAWDVDGERVEVTKDLLRRLRGLLNDPKWRARLTGEDGVGAPVGDRE